MRNLFEFFIFLGVSFLIRFALQENLLTTDQLLIFGLSFLFARQIMNNTKK